MLMSVDHTDVLNGLLKDILNYCVRYSCSPEDAANDYDCDLTQIISPDEYDTLIEFSRNVLASLNGNLRWCDEHNCLEEK